MAVAHVITKNSVNLTSIGFQKGSSGLFFAIRFNRKNKLTKSELFVFINFLETSYTCAVFVRGTLFPK